jgi:creatinine amidohydrolase
MDFWAEMTSSAIEKGVKDGKVVIVPVGSTEQRGPHLPTGTDQFIGWEIAKRVAERVDALLLPIIPIGFSENHCPRAGTVTLSPDTLRHMIRDVAKSLSRDGAKHIVLMSGHAGHLVQLADVCCELNVRGTLGQSRIHNISPYNSVGVEALARILEEEVFLHAEELETSLMLFLRPHLVQMDKAVREIPAYLPKGLTTPNFLEAIRVFTTSKSFGKDLKTGVCGDATLASREKGEKLLDVLVNATVEAIKRATKE